MRVHGFTCRYEITLLNDCVCILYFLRFLLKPPHSACIHKASAGSNNGVTNAVFVWLWDASFFNVLKKGWWVVVFVVVVVNHDVVYCKHEIPFTVLF